MKLYQILFGSLLLLITQYVFAEYDETPRSPNKCNSSNFQNCLNGVGPAVTSSDGLKATARLVSDKARQRKDQNEDFTLSQFGKGRSAGDDFSSWSVWGGINSADYDANPQLNNAFDFFGNPVTEAVYDTKLDSLSFGADTVIGSQLLLGMAVNYERSDTNTEYNGGESDSDGYGLIPYAAYLINDNFNIDVAAGYTNLSYDTDRIDNTNGSTIRGDFDADRWFVVSNLNANFSYQNWYLGGRIGYLYTEEDQDSYTETGGPTARAIDDREVDLSQFIAGVNASYSLGRFEPYVSLTYFNDISRDEGEDAGGLPGGVAATIDDDDEIQYTVGVLFYDSAVTGTLEWSKTVGRQNFDGDALSFTLRADL